MDKKKGQINMKRLLYIAVMILSLRFGCKDNPVKPDKPENRSPVIFSVTVFPEIIGPSDSAIVICNAMDPNADTLVYDWITDGRLNIKGAASFDPHELYNTYENSRVVYPSQYVNVPLDTPWVQCFARDRKGGVGCQSRTVYSETIRGSHEYYQGKMNPLRTWQHERRKYKMEITMSKET